MLGHAIDLDDVVKFGSKHLGFFISLDQKVENKPDSSSENQKREVINLEEDLNPKTGVDSNIDCRPELGHTHNDSGLGSSICQLPSEYDYVEIIDEESRTGPSYKDSVRNKESGSLMATSTELEVIEIDTETSIINNKSSSDKFNKPQSENNSRCMVIDLEPTHSSIFSQQIHSDDSIEIVDLERSDSSFNDENTSGNIKTASLSSTKRPRQESGHFNKKRKSEEAQLEEKALLDQDAPVTEQSKTVVAYLKRAKIQTKTANNATTAKSQEHEINTRASSSATTTTTVTGLHQGSMMVQTTVYIDNLEESFQEISTDMKRTKKMIRLLGNSENLEVVAGDRHGYKTRNNTIKTLREKPRPKRFQKIKTDNQCCEKGRNKQRYEGCKSLTPNY
jgi:hypothetical protein